MYELAFEQTNQFAQFDLSSNPGQLTRPAPGAAAE